MSHRLRTLTAWPLALMMTFAAGCGSEHTTGVSMDTVAPTINFTTPVNGSASVTPITASFSEAMNASTLTTATFAVAGPGVAPVTGIVIYNAATEMASFVPANALEPNTMYTATITTGATDVAGNPLATNHLWSFSTSTTIGSSAGPALGAAGNFVILAGSTVTSTGGTVVTGDLGLSPGSVVTGFPPGLLIGTRHVADVAAVAAKLALTVAFNNLAGRTAARISVAGNIGGTTLTPGLYKSTSSLMISSGDLTLDARGDANAVFLFQVASTLTVGAGRAVILAGGARSSNVYWAVGSSATLGTTSVFKGTIMANQSITLNTGATLQGRALARIGAVSLAGNAAVLPTLELAGPSGQGDKPVPNHL